jgi:DNA helicase-2/ATP-dependent DNA helicase PcrA
VTRRIDKPDTDADIELRGYLDAERRSSFVMIAGAGSGKTTSLVKALDHIGKKYGADLRRRGQQVACITYTDVAVGEIFGDLGDQPLFHVSTIHSFLWTIAKPFQKDIARWVKQRTEARLVELREESEGFGPRVHQKTKDENARDFVRTQSRLDTIDTIKYYKYESGRDHSKGILGHDDIIKMVPQLIKEKPLLAKIVAQKFPFVFVDESQDTFPEFVKALRKIAQQTPDKFCLGFFGDPMQQIYTTGVGDIVLDKGWQRITKPENFRCPTSVLSVINNIRSGADKLEQTRGRQEFINDAPHPGTGTVHVFILPADDQRSANLDRVRSYLADKHSDPNWSNNAPKSALRILVIAHRMAAARLGFEKLFEAFNNKTSTNLQASFKEGTTWALRPFLDVLLPLAKAYEENRSFDLMALLRAHCPRLSAEPLKRVDNVAALLVELKNGVCKLVELMSDTSEATLLDVLKFADKAELISLEDRVKYFLRLNPGELPEVAESAQPSSGADQEEKETRDAPAIAEAFTCPARQIRGYYNYLNDDSPYSTQHGIKGAEFERVMVVLDDEKGKHNQFSYDKLFGLKVPSKQDNENRNQNKGTVVDRTRRLFYVCCSRATKDLAIVLYSADVAKATAQVTASGLFQPGDICPIGQLAPSLNVAEGSVVVSRAVRKPRAK